MHASFVVSVGSSARCEFAAIPSNDAVRGTSRILDRATGRTVAKYTYVQGLKAGSLPGLPTLQPWSCRAGLDDREPAAHLADLLFVRAGDSVLRPEGLKDWVRQPWQVLPRTLPDPDLPRGEQGVQFWVDRGQIRALTSKEFSLWRSAADPAHRLSISWVPDRTYVFTEQVTLPPGLQGMNAGYWILQPGQSMPAGPRGEAMFFEVGKGCVWPLSRCDEYAELLAKP